jgi:hypothetical protein
MVGEDGKAVIPRMKIPGTRVSGWTTQPGYTSHSMVSLAIIACLSLHRGKRIAHW